MLIIVLSSHPALRDIPIVDHVPEDGDRAIPGQARDFRSLENITRLRQLDAATTDGDLILFTPATACRSANGVVRSWCMGEGGERVADARLGVVYAGGEVVGTVEPAGEGAERVLWPGLYGRVLSPCLTRHGDAPIAVAFTNEKLQRKDEPFKSHNS